MHDVEYNTVCEMFPDHNPKKISRIQHPTAYLRYLVQTEYLNESKIPFTEVGNLNYSKFLLNL